jgi:hypothetical protein
MPTSSSNKSEVANIDVGRYAPSSREPFIQRER